MLKPSAAPPSNHSSSVSTICSEPGGRLAVNSADADRPHQSGQLIREALRELGLHAAARNSALGTRYRVNARALSRLLRDAGFVNTDPGAHLRRLMTDLPTRKLGRTGSAADACGWHARTD